MNDNSEIKRWHERCQSWLDAAADEARRLQHSYVGVEHLFNALTRPPGSQAERILRSLGLDASQIRDAIRRETGTGKGTPSGFQPFTPRLLTILRLAEQHAGLNAPLTETHLLRALFEEGESLPVRYLSTLGYQPATCLARLAAAADPAAADQTRLAANPAVADQTRLAADPEAVEGTRISTDISPSPVSPAVRQPTTAVPGPTIAPQASVPMSLPTLMLDEYGRDLSKLARLGKLVEAIGRESEIEQIITILARTQKSNPLVLGEAGVGKTAIVEGLAWRIVHGEVPPVLHGKRIVEIDMGVVMAIRGDPLGNIKKVINEAVGAPEVILFIDEIHTIVGAGKGAGAMDAAQMFKPALARGDISCIGATTQDEYTQYIRKDPALERRFSPVVIEEMTPEATSAVLQKVAPRIVEKQAGRGYQLNIAPDALRAAVTLTDKYVKNRQQPDKGIDAIDIACARAVVSGKTNVSAEDIAQVVSNWTGIPATRLTSDEQQRYAQMEATLHQRVIGQDAAVSAVSRSVRAALAGLKSPSRPVGVFLFMGPSGTGKTKLAKELASFLFDTPDALIRFDMSEYQEKHTVSNLLGSPRGYIDSERGGQFTEAMRRRPYSVVLLDEIEKAHPDVFNIFLSVFDDGRVTDNMGRAIDCSNAVFILTSNLGIGEIDFARIAPAELRTRAARFLRPELVNRITEVVGFTPLGRSELARILELVLAEKLEGFRTAQQITVTVDESAKEFVLRNGFDPCLGARPLERAVEQLIVQPLVDAIFAGQITAEEVLATTREGKIVFIPAGREAKS